MKTRKQQEINIHRPAQTRLATTVTRSAVALAILTAAQSPLVARPAATPVAAEESEGEGDHNQLAYEKFFNCGYNYADAKLLAAYWDDGGDVQEAKARLGNKMLRFGPDDGLAVITEARTATLKKPEEQWPIDYSDGGYSFEDAEALGAFWGTDVGEAKTKMARMLIKGENDNIQAALKDSDGGNVPEGNDGNDAAYQKYFNMGFNYADAKVMAAFWNLGEDTDDAKVRMGNKMLQLGPDQGLEAIKEARDAALKKPEARWPVDYSDGNYSFEDAEKLGEFWGSGTGEAKTKIARMLIQGKDEDIRAALSAAEKGGGEEPEGDNQAAFDKYFDNGYDYDDALILAAFWNDGTSHGDAKVRMGNKMLENGPAAGRTFMRAARAEALQKPESEWPVNYTDGGYSYEDAEALGKYWECDTQESKTKMARMLIQGKDKELAAALESAKDQ